MTIQNNWKEKVNKFFRAKVLEECEDRVVGENIRMLCLLNLGIVFCSLLLAAYTTTRTQGRGYLQYIYVGYLLVAFVMFILVIFRKYTSIRETNLLIGLDYILLVSYFLLVNVVVNSETFTTAYYVLMVLVFGFLVKPLRLIVMQTCMTVTICLCTTLCKAWHYAEMDIINMMLMFVISIIVGCAILEYRMTALEKLDEKEQALIVTELYQSIIDETQTAVYVRKLHTGEILYLNRKAKKIFHIDDEKCPIYPTQQAEKEEFIECEIFLDGRYYQTKGKVIDWCGEEAYVKYLIDVTDSKIVGEQMRIEHEQLQKKYQEEMIYREKAVSEDVLATSRVNITRGIVEEMRVGNEEGYEKKYWHCVEFVERVQAFTRKIWLSEEQERRLSPKGLMELFESGITSVSEEYIGELLNGRHVWIRVEVNLLQRPETSEVMAFIYNRDITVESKMKQILEHMMSFEYDEIYTVDGQSGQFDTVVIGQYALDNQISQGDYQEELCCLVERAELEEDKELIQKELSLENLKERLQKEPVFEIEVSLKSKSGKMRLKQIRCTYLNEQIGAILMTLSDIDDVVKDEKAKQERLAQALSMAEAASKAKTKFLASMSHEIRTPMNVIISLNSIIKQSVNDKSQVLDCTEKLDSASKFLLTLLNDILDMSRIESGNTTLVHQPFEGKKFWDDVNLLAMAQAQPASIHYVFERGEKVSDMYIGDATRLKQIMVNLINNAVKFTPENGEVKVFVDETEIEGRVRMRVRVSDNGIGISKEFLPNIFETFTQQHTENTTAYGGSGLGLSIAKNYAEMMDGTITVESTEGEGTVFTVEVFLDIDKKKVPQMEGPSKEKEYHFSGKRILLVEDHPLNTMVAKGLLEKKGFEIVHAENGKLAVELFKKNVPHFFDAVLMDIRMPVMDGIEATKKIRALDRSDAMTIPIIAMTANAYEEDRQQTKAAGMAAHLAKPIDPSLLFETLNQFL